jgi:hypothetical protein
MEKGMWCREPIVPFKVMAAAMIRLPIALHVSLAICQVPANLHGTCGFSPAETKCDLTVSLYPTLWSFYANLR